MGAKRWQIEELEKRIKILDKKIEIALSAINAAIQFFENLPKNAKGLRQAKTEIEKTE
jgi:hypothetical protein